MKRALLVALLSALPAAAQGLAAGAGLSTGSFSASLLTAGATGSTLTLSGAFTSTAAGGADGFVCSIEGCEFQIGPDTKLAESGTKIVATAAGGFSTTALFEQTGNSTNTYAGPILSTYGTYPSFYSSAANGGIQVQGSAGAFGFTNKMDINTAPTVVACIGGTAASITASNGSAAFQFDVGTVCAGDSTAVITLPAATTGWVCSCSSTTADQMLQQKAAGTTTAVTMTNILISTGATQIFTDGADVFCMCRGY